jgi:DNA-binding CsgD family transcriptional regulator
MQQAESSHRPSRKLMSAFEVHGEASLAAAEFDEAEAAFRAGLNEAEALADRAAAARMWHRLGVLARRREQPEQAAFCLNEALTTLDALGREDADLIEVLIELAGLEGLTRARYDQAEAFAQRAMTLAGHLSLRAAEAKASLALANSRTRSDDPAAGAVLLEQALGKALLAGDPSLAAEACAGLSNSCYWQGEMQLALRYAERRRELAEQAGDLFGLRHAYTWKALILSSFGRWQEARELLVLAEPLLSRLDSPEPIAFLKIVSARIDLETGELEGAYEHASEAISLFEQMDPGTLVWYEAVLVQACLGIARRTEAEAHITNLERLLAGLPQGALPARSARTALGRIYADLQDTDAAARCEAALRPFPNDYHWVQARLVLGRLAALRGDREAALADFEAAEAWSRSQGLHFDYALTSLARIEALGPAAQPAEIDACRALLQELGALPSLQRLDAFAQSRSRSAPHQLTPREVEVLRLVAQGLTNRQIAEVLVISERTAINHVSHIFAKIGVEHRSAATAFALRHGLV